MNRFKIDLLGLYLAMTIVWGVSCWLNLAADVGRPFPGFLTFHTYFGHKINVARYTPAWWWGITEQDVALDDTIVQVEGVPFEGISQMVDEAAIYEQAAANGQQTVTVQIRRNGSLTLYPAIIPFSWQHVIDITFSPLIAAVCFWLLAIILYRAGAKTRAQKLTIILLAQFALLLLGNRMSLFEYQWRYLILVTGVQLTGTTSGIILIHLSYYFPFERPRWHKIWQWLWRSLYALAALIALIYILAHFHLGQQGITPLAVFSDTLWFYSFTALGILGFAVFILRLLAEWLLAGHNPRVRRETGILLASIMVASPAIWLALNGGDVESKLFALLSQLADLRFFALALPFAFAALTLRYQTFPGANQWLMVVLLLALSGLGANVGATLLFQQSPALVRTLPVPPAITFFSLLLGVSLFWSWQSQWQGWLGRLFEWERIGYQAIHRVGQALLGRPYSSSQQLAQNMAEVLCRELALERVGFWLKVGTDFRRQAAYGQWLGSVPERLCPPCELSALIFRLQEGEETWLRPLFPHIAVLIPLHTDQGLLGLMGLGKRWDTAAFDDRDLQTLTLMGQQAALFLYNAQQSDQLRTADRHMLQIQEKTRRQLAQDLHDYVLPTLGRLPLHLQTGINYLTVDTQKTEQILQQSQAELQTVAQKMRFIQQDLVLRPLEYGLAVYLAEMAQQFQNENEIDVNIYLPANLDEVVADLGVRQAVYAVCQQAFDNIQAHAQATNVTVKIHDEANKVCFVIRDNGIGCTMAQQEMAQRHGRFGLKSMQIRMAEVGGNFQFESYPGKGTTIRLFLSINKGNK